MLQPCVALVILLILLFAFQLLLLFTSHYFNSLIVTTFLKDSSLRILEKAASARTEEKQAEHTIDAARMTEFNLKYTIMKLVEHLFGEDVEMRWVDAYFPFTHPSWELEVKLNGEWMEMLGCGILEQQILKYGTHVFKNTFLIFYHIFLKSGCIFIGAKTF